jgi:predicted DNA-binding transcriptional regulator AlpA
MTEYLDTAAVARMLDVRAETVSRYKHRDPTFPDPDITLSGRPGWKRSTIRAWMRQRPGRGAGGGRPSKDAQYRAM